VIPDTSDADKMALIGRITVLRRHRRELAQKLRDKIVPMLNSIEQHEDAWDLSGIEELINGIRDVNHAIFTGPRFSGH
jgi:hypothetical protein